MLRQAIRGVRDAQRLAREGEALLRQLHRILERGPVDGATLGIPTGTRESADSVGRAQASRPSGTTHPPQRKAHGPDCRHSQLVEGYPLARASELRYPESLACG